LAFCQEVHVQVGNAFAGIGAVVDDEAEAAGELKFFGDGAGREEQEAENRFVGGRRFAYTRNYDFGDDEQVHRRLRIDVVDDDAAVVLVFDFRGDLAVDDTLEKGLHWGSSQ